MLSLILSPIIVYASRDSVCFDLIVDDGVYPTDSEQIHEDTKDTVCVWQDGVSKHCVSGLYVEFMHTDVIDMNTHIFPNCVYFSRGVLSKDDIYVEIDGSDAVWIDQITVSAKHFSKTWGYDNSAGWCLSRDINDHLGWNSDDRDQHVPEGRCYHKIGFKKDGKVSGYYSGSSVKYCRETKKMDCKQGCIIGWTHESTSYDGCCRGVFDCFGHRKTCYLDSPCRRRVEDGVVQTEQFSEISEDLAEDVPAASTFELVNQVETASRLERLEGEAEGGEDGFVYTSEPDRRRSELDTEENIDALMEISASSASSFRECAQGLDELDEDQQMWAGILSGANQGILMSSEDGVFAERRRSVWNIQNFFTTVVAEMSEDCEAPMEVFIEDCKEVGNKLITAEFNEQPIFVHNEPRDGNGLFGCAKLATSHVCEEWYKYNCTE